MKLWLRRDLSFHTLGRKKSSNLYLSLNMLSSYTHAPLVVLKFFCHVFLGFEQWNWWRVYILTSEVCEWTGLSVTSFHLLLSASLKKTSLILNFPSFFLNFLRNILLTRPFAIHPAVHRLLHLLFLPSFPLSSCLPAKEKMKEKKEDGKTSKGYQCSGSRALHQLLLLKYCFSPITWKETDFFVSKEKRAPSHVYWNWNPLSE